MSNRGGGEGEREGLDAYETDFFHYLTRGKPADSAGAEAPPLIFAIPGLRVIAAAHCMDRSSSRQ